MFAHLLVLLEHCLTKNQVSLRPALSKGGVMALQPARPRKLKELPSHRLGNVGKYTKQQTDIGKF